MWKVTIKGILAKKVRFLLTGFAVMLGVAFISGTFVLTATISNTFDGLFSDIYQHTDAVVRAKETFSGSFGGGRGTISATLLPSVRSTDGVAQADGTVQGLAIIVDKHGDALGSNGRGAPTFGFAYIPDRDLSTIHVVQGRGPAFPTEVVIDKKSADDAGYRPGDTVPVVTKAGRNDYTLTGIVKFGTADSPLGATIAAFTPTTASKVLGTPGQFDSIDVKADPGVSQDQVVSNIRAVLEARAGDGQRRGAQRQGHHQGESEQSEGQPVVLQHVPPHLRCGRAARRFLHHLQHVFDHRRPTQPGARVAAPRSAPVSARSSVRCCSRPSWSASPRPSSGSLAGSSSPPDSRRSSVYSDSTFRRARSSSRRPR